ncbi:MAG: (2Fe-2S)-binding protein [Hyphomicrobiaceae bacterium]
MSHPDQTRGLLRRIGCADRATIRLHVDGIEVTALVGDTLLTAVLASHARLRESEFGDGPRAGFCMMGVCQDCWVTTESGERLRACTTQVTDGMQVTTGVAWLVRP